jgi:hypothetical protein
MRSSPTDAGTKAAANESDLLLQRLDEVYNETFGALQQGELERMSKLLDAADDLIEKLCTPQASGVPKASRTSVERAKQAHGRVTDGVQQTSKAVQDELQKIRRGKRSLRAYGNRGDSTVGHRVSSKA